MFPYDDSTRYFSKYIKCLILVWNVTCAVPTVDFAY